MTDPTERPVRLAGRVVVVARADTDDGAGLAREVAAAGAHVVLAGEDAAPLGALAASLQDAYGVRVAVFAGTVTDPPLAEMVAELFDA